MWRVCLGWVPFAVFGHFTTASLIGVQTCSDLEVLGGSSGGLGGWGWGGVMHAAHLNSTKQYRCGIMDNFWTGIVLVCCFNLKGLNQSIPIYLSGPVLSYPILSTYMMCVYGMCGGGVPIPWSPRTKTRYMCKVGNRKMTSFGLGSVRRKEWAESVYKNWLLVHPTWEGPFALWLFNIAMENGPFIDGLPIKNGDFPWLC